jgi:ATP-dependent Lon protease
VLFIEVGAMPGTGKLTITGQLGDVMRESAQAALSWVRGHADGSLPEDWFARNDLHIHVPAGAIPKDGPSAGVTMVTALVSMLTGRPVRDDVAMTGEVTLHGEVLPIGGLKEKALAAQRLGIRTIIAPSSTPRTSRRSPNSCASSSTSTSPGGSRRSSTLRSSLRG